MKAYGIQPKVVNRGPLERDIHIDEHQPVLYTFNDCKQKQCSYEVSAEVTDAIGPIHDIWGCGSNPTEAVQNLCDNFDSIIQKMIELRLWINENRQQIEHSFNENI